MAIRPAAVAGMFYPDAPRVLRAEVDRLLGAAAVPPEAATPKALIAPHAGYVYSGPTAASAYARLAPIAQTVRRVVLLGPAHRVGFDGIALPGATGFDTPLGTVPIDADAAASVRRLPQVHELPAAHAHEHALEVELPFLQRALREFKLLPLLVGRARASLVADVLDLVWGGPETLIVISSDLSHYRSYPDARERDGETVRQILDGMPTLDHEQACGATPINGLLLATAARGLAPELLDLCNSGDTAGPRDSVVGYAAFQFTSPATMSHTELGAALLRAARSTLECAFGHGAGETPRDPALDAPGATFVTLMQHDELRGCVGTLEAHRSLREDVTVNTLAAAFHDPRFAPLAASELAHTRIEVSLLTPPAPLPVADERELWQRLQPGVDGVVLAWRGQRATFLPQVWERLAEPRVFVEALKRKAGLDPAFWDEEIAVSRYLVTKYREPLSQGALK